MSRLEAGVNREKEKGMETKDENNSPDNETQNQKESEMDPNEAAAGQQEPPAELPDPTDEEAEELTADDETTQETEDEIVPGWVMAVGAAALLLLLLGVGWAVFGDDDTAESDQQIAQKQAEESDDSQANDGDSEEVMTFSDEAGETGDAEESEKAMADSDETENPDAEKESGAAKAAAGDLDGCQLKRRNGKDVGMLMNSEQNGVVLECDDGLYTVQARVRDGNVEVKTSTLQPFEGDEEDILFVKRSE
jgi:type IV secretory pathway VirB10-like protein